MQKNKSFVVVFILVIVVGLSSFSTSNKNHSSRGLLTANHDKKEEFKNLQVLPNDISDEKLDSIMDGFKIGLGVKCGFCHVRIDIDSTHHKWDFASDTKETKLRARDMMRMTNNLNATVFNQQKSTQPDTIHVVQCYTCHRGKHLPDISEMPKEEKH